jgi:hypothetical protein
LFPHRGFFYAPGRPNGATAEGPSLAVFNGRGKLPQTRPLKTLTPHLRNMS